MFVEAENNAEIPENVFIENDGYVCMKAADYQHRHDTADGGFKILCPCTRELSAIKAFPVTTDFMEVEQKPYVEYKFIADKNQDYNIRFYLEASTPVTYEAKQFICFSVNDGDIVTINTVNEPDKQFFLSAQWSREATDHVKLADFVVKCRKGLNTLRFYAASPAIVLEKIVLYPCGTQLKTSYMGPKESYIKKLP